MPNMTVTRAGMTLSLQRRTSAAASGQTTGSVLGAWIGANFETPVVVGKATVRQDDFTSLRLEQHIAATDTWILASMLTNLDLVPAH